MIQNRISHIVNNIHAQHNVTCYAVGGYVRDKIFNTIHKTKVVPLDIDIMGDFGNTERMVFILKHIGDCDLSHLPYGIIKVRIDDQVIDFSVPRVDLFLNGDRFKFQVNTNKIPVTKDMERRDFTINAMAVDLITGKIIDPFNGVDDIITKTLRPVSNSFIEDPIRVIRGITLIARMGLTPCQEFTDMSSTMIGAIKKMSKTRTRKEFAKMIDAPHAEKAINSMKEIGLIEIWEKL